MGASSKAKTNQGEIMKTAKLKEAPTLKGFLTKAQAQHARQTNELPFGVVFSYSDCNNRCDWCCYFTDVNAPRNSLKEFTMREEMKVYRHYDAHGQCRAYGGCPSYSFVILDLLRNDFFLFLNAINRLYPALSEDDKKQRRLYDSVHKMAEGFN